MNLGISGRDLVGPVGVAAAVVFAVLLVRSCNRADTAEDELRRERGAGKLRDAGLPPEESVDTKALKTELEKAKADSALFKATVESLTEKLRDLNEHPKVVEVVRYVTKPGAAGGSLPGGEPKPGGSTTGGGEARDSCDSCLVSPGDTLQIAVSEATLATKSGNRIVTGSAACRRLKPEPETTIYEAPIEMALTNAKELETPPAPSSRPWIAGLVGAYGGTGKWGVGPSVGYSTSRLMFTLGGTFGGESQAIAAVHGRF